MGALFAYILKSGICLALFYLFYRLLLSKETFHRFNRIALLGVLGFSVLLPSIKYTYTINSFPEPVISEFPVEEDLLVSLERLPLILEHPILLPEDPVANTSYWCILLLIYLGGVGFFLLQTIWSFFTLFRLSRTGNYFTKEGNVKIYITEKNISPFSWMNRVVMSAEDWKENRKEILSHEVGHCRCGHSWDLLFIHLCTIFHWFNPAAWLLKQELQNIHEFEADEHVLNKGINIKQYQLLLIKKAVGTQRFTSMANSFNHSKLKKRITMMLKGKSNPWARLKYLYVLPVSLIVLTGFARPEITDPLEKISAVKISEIFPEEKMQEDPNSTFSKVESREYVITGSKEIVSDSIEDPDISSILEEVKQLADNLEGMEFEFPFSMDSISSSIREEAERLLAQDLPEVKTGVVIVSTQQDTIPESGEKKSSSEFWIRGFSEFGTDESALVLIDGKEGRVTDLDVTDIDSFSVLKDASATAIYGEKGKNGVILITTKKSQENKPVLKGDIKYKHTEEDKEGAQQISVISTVKTISKSDSENSEEEVSEFWIRGVSSFGANESALVLIDGKEGNLTDLDITDIDSFSVLKDASATAIYGEKGKNGVVLITTKKLVSSETVSADEDQPHFYIAMTKAKRIYQKNDVLRNANLNLSLTTKDSTDFTNRFRRTPTDELELNFRKIKDKARFEKTVTVFINEKEATYEEYEKLAPSDIESFHIVSDAKDEDASGKAKLYITTKSKEE